MTKEVLALVESLAKQGTKIEEKAVLAAPPPGLALVQIRSYLRETRAEREAGWRSVLLEVVTPLLAAYEVGEVGEAPEEGEEEQASPPSALPAHLTRFRDKGQTVPAGAVRAVIVLQARGEEQAGILLLWERAGGRWAARMEGWIEPFEDKSLQAAWQETVRRLEAAGHGILSVDGIALRGPWKGRAPGG